MLLNIYFYILIIIFVLFSCEGCSKSARKARQNGATTQRSISSRENRGSATIKMVKIGGVYQIPIEVNDIPLYFVFDTGASTISISTTEALLMLKQGKLSKNDIIGKSEYTTATGEVYEGTIIKLRKVKIANKIISNVKANVVNNLDAPLLLGQSALNQFGKISIDYKKGTISFGD